MFKARNKRRRRIEFGGFYHNHFPKLKQRLNLIIYTRKRQWYLSNELGNIEYKLKLINPSSDRVDQLTTQMKFRLAEGFGEAYYRIGVEDNGRPTGLSKEDMF